MKRRIWQPAGTLVALSVSAAGLSLGCEEQPGDPLGQPQGAQPQFQPMPSEQPSQGDQNQNQQPYGTSPYNDQSPPAQSP